MKFTITKAKVKTTQYGDLAIFETAELGNVKSFNDAPIQDAKDIVAGKIALPKAVVAVTVKSKKTGRDYIALQEA